MMIESVSENPSIAIPESREVRELRLLLEIGQILSSSDDLRTVAEPILECMAEHLDMLRGAISLVNEDDETVNIEAGFGLSLEDEALEGARLIESLEALEESYASYLTALEASPSGDGSGTILDLIKRTLR